MKHLPGKEFVYKENGGTEIPVDILLGIIRRQFGIY
jgi:hypothetical protein